MKAKFITFEGCDGCGKTTQSKLLYEYMMKHSIPTVWTREIGGTDEAEKIREIVLHNQLLQYTELLLVMAARYEHITNLIKPLLNEGIWVICDRFIDSTACYQAASSRKNCEITMDEIYEMHAKIFGNFWPDTTFFIDTDAPLSLERARDRKNNNKFDNMGIEHYKIVYNNYKAISTKYDRIVTISGCGTKEEIHNKILNYLHQTGIYVRQ